MGGCGSGSWFRWDKKDTTESQHRVDIRWLNKQGRLRPGTMGSFSWSRRGEETGSIRYGMEADRMVLTYRHRPHGGEWEDVEQEVSFDSDNVQLWRPQEVVSLPALQPTGGCSLWSGKIFSLPALLWSNLPGIGFLRPTLTCKLPSCFYFSHIVPMRGIDKVIDRIICR